MKIICNKTDFASAINIVSKAVAVKSTVTIMECILITAYGDEIKLAANNNELGIETILNGKIEEEGMIALESKFLSEYIRTLQDDEVILTTNDRLSTTIVCANSETTIIGQRGDNFSYLPEIEKENAVEISQFSLREMIRQTIFSISNSEANAVMNGEQFEINDNRLQLASVDGHRFSIRRLELNDSYGNMNVIVPGKTLAELNKILKDDADEIVQLFFSKNHMMFMFDDTTVVTRLIDGQFMDMNRMITGEYETKISISKKEMQECLHRANIFSKEGDKKPIVMTVTGNELSIDMNSVIGSFNEKIAIEKEGNDVRIGFNPSFFLDVLNVISDETINIYLGDAKYPCFIKDEKESYIYMILPVNI